MPSVKMSAQDRKWQAEDDFRSLVSAEEVRTDKARSRRAKVAGRKMVRIETKVLGIKRRLAQRDRSRRR